MSAKCWFATSLGVDFALTVSCYQADGEGRACGVCDSCRLRAEGFAAAGIPCPWAYWQERCHRSLEQAWRAVAKSRSGTPWPKYTDYSPAKHNAEVDAKQQATYLIKLAAQVRSQQP